MDGRRWWATTWPRRCTSRLTPSSPPPPPNTYSGQTGQAKKKTHRARSSSETWATLPLASPLAPRRTRTPNRNSVSCRKYGSEFVVSSHYLAVVSGDATVGDLTKALLITRTLGSEFRVTATAAQRRHDWLDRRPPWRWLQVDFASFPLLGSYSERLVLSGMVLRKHQGSF